MEEGLYPLPCGATFRAFFLFPLYCCQSLSPPNTYTYISQNLPQEVVLAPEAQSSSSPLPSEPPVSEVLPLHGSISEPLVSVHLPLPICTQDSSSVFLSLCCSGSLPLHWPLFNPSHPNVCPFQVLPPSCG